MASISIQRPPPAAMAHPRAYPVSHRPSTVSSLESLTYHASTARIRFFRFRVILVLLALMVIAVMGISLVFVAHAFYHQWGGQGFLKRDVSYASDHDLSLLFLPLRKIQTAWDELEGDSESLLLNLPWNTRSLGPGSNVPYYTCGDQASSCSAYDQPVSPIQYLSGYASADLPEHMLSGELQLLQRNVHQLWNILLQRNKV